MLEPEPKLVSLLLDVIRDSPRSQSAAAAIAYLRENVPLGQDESSDQLPVWAQVLGSGASPSVDHDEGDEGGSLGDILSYPSPRPRDSNNTNHLHPDLQPTGIRGPFHRIPATDGTPSEFTTDHLKAYALMWDMSATKLVQFFDSDLDTIQKYLSDVKIPAQILDVSLGTKLATVWRKHPDDCILTRRSGKLARLDLYTTRLPEALEEAMNWGLDPMELMTERYWARNQRRLIRALEKKISDKIAGGTIRNLADWSPKKPCACRITHEPTGLAVECDESPYFHINRNRATKELAELVQSERDGSGQTPSQV